VIRTGAPWRDLPERYGRWHSIYTRFARWSRSGVFDPVLARLGRGNDEASLIQLLDGTVVRAHQHAAGAKGGSRARR
jgi:transposase